MFLVPKKSGELRPVINQTTKTEHLKMDTMNKVLNLVKKGCWALTVELQDAYCHIPTFQGHRNSFTILHSGQSIPVLGISFRSKTFAKGVHKDRISRRSTLKDTEQQTGSLFGRLVSPECNSEIAFARLTENNQSSFSTRFSDKCRQAGDNTNSRHNLHRWKVFVGQRYSSSNCNQSVKIKGKNLSDKKTIRHSKTVFTDAQPDGFLHRDSTICKTSYEANAVASTVLVETSIRRSLNADSKTETSSRSTQLVVTGRKHAQGQILSS